MPSLNLLVIFALALAFVVVGILLFPNVKKAKGRKKRRYPKLPEDENKNWKQVSLSLEKHIYSLRKELVVLERKEKSLEKELIIQKEKYEKAREKLSQERGWKKKEASDIEKKSLEIVQLRKDLHAAEQSLSKEHGSRLRSERELKVVSQEMSESKESLRQLETQNAAQKAQIEDYRKEMSELKAMNQRLAKKHDDATWVAKSEYVKMETELKMEIRSCQREIDRLKTILRKEGFQG